ncbi:MAG: hypothetical protein AAF789_06045 [Bacteroidota bacterium]
MKRKLAFVFALAMGQSALLAQFGYFSDALRFSQTNYSLGSTARMQGFAGAQVALGGDISSAVANPAGLGFFNQSVFVVTPSMSFNSNSTSYGLLFDDGPVLDPSTETFQNNFNFANIGTVIHYGQGRYGNDKFKGGSLAISLSRSSDFNRTISYEGANDFNSIADSFAQSASLLPPSTGLQGFLDAADRTQLINEDLGEEGISLGYFAQFDGFPFQQEVIEQSGSHYELNLAWGGNYDDVFYFGGGLGLQIINYSESRRYQESEFLVFDDQGNGTLDERLNAIFLDEEFEVRGSGIDFNVGMTIRPAPFMTIGASYTSPSFLALEDEISNDFEVVWVPGATFIDLDGNEIDLASEDTRFVTEGLRNTYQLRTPSRIAVGTAFFIGKSGFLTGDLEFIDYSNATLNSLDFSVREDNDEINRLYTSVMNVRAGGEYRFENFRLRAGYAFFPDPFEGSSIGDQTNITFGIGYRTADYFIDLAIVNSRFDTEAVPYSIFGQPQPFAATETNNTVASITLGLNF